MKKKLLTIGIAIASFLILLQGCSNYQEEVEIKTSEFLTAYFNGDYEKAVSFCTDSLGGEISKMLSSFETLDPSIKDMVKRQASSLTTEIISIEKSESKDTITVNYKVLLPYTPSGIDNSLSFTKEEKEWKVARLGNKL